MTSTAEFTSKQQDVRDAAKTLDRELGRLRRPGGAHQPGLFLNSSLRRQPSIGPTRAPADALSCATSARIPSAMNKVGLYARCSFLPDRC